MNKRIVSFLKEHLVPVIVCFALAFALGATSWLTMARIVRGQVLSLKNEQFIEAARCVGVSNTGIILRHIVPNAFGPIVVYATLTVPSVILAEAFLSFLGLGVPPPISSWGSMIGEGRESLDVAPRLAFLPAAAMFLTVLSFNLVGDTLRALTDPRQGAL